MPVAKNLVVVESPAKAKTIERYLGPGYKVVASMGHVRDLPKKEIGVDVDNDFAAKYVTTRGRGKILTAMRSAAKTAQSIYLATDLDREGEAIAWHIAEVLKFNPDQTFRVVFNEITKGAIKEAFSQPGHLDMDKVNAQQARRILDRLVGYKLSPLLWKKIRRGLSAGRVQSVAVRLVVEREREIEAFKPEEYWRIRVQLKPQGAEGDTDQFQAELVKFAGEKFRPSKGDDAERIAEELRQAAYTVADRQVKRRKDKAPPPFITSELQRAASTQMRFSSRRTMSTAQGLYEGVNLGKRGQVALITYMRTDSHRVAQSAIQGCRAFIAKTFGDDYLPEKPHYFSSKKGAQEAHEAIRPTDAALTPEEVEPFLTSDQFRLYTLIWKRFVASQMKPAEWDVTTLKVAAGQGELKATGRTLVYDGHTRVTGIRMGADEQIVPAVEQGQPLELIELTPSQHFTQPPPRYSEATLIRELERCGIGRPSTYASILSTIEDRGYAEQIERRYHATDIGKVVTDKLVEHFPKILNVDFTRHMEEDLDKVEVGERSYLDVLREFYGPFTEALDAAMENMKRPEPKDTGRACPECGSKLIERMGRYGMFVGCSGYPDCKFIEKAKKKPPAGEETDLPCPACGKPLIRVKSRRGVTYYACIEANECGKVMPAKGPAAEKSDEAEAAEPDASAPPPMPYEPEPCTECGEPMVVRLSRGEPFLGCSAYPKCKTTRPLGPKRKGKGKGGRRGGGRTRAKKLETDVQCEKCGKLMVVRSSRRGPFLACPGYPKCKNAKDATPEQVADFNALNTETDDKADPDKTDDSKADDSKTAADTKAGSAPARKPPKT
jgi:DNA topoisomerase I